MKVRMLLAFLTGTLLVLGDVKKSPKCPSPKPTGTFSNHPMRTTGCLGSDGCRGCVCYRCWCGGVWRTGALKWSYLADGPRTLRMKGSWKKTQSRSTLMVVGTAIVGVGGVFIAQDENATGHRLRDGRRGRSGYLSRLFAD